MDSARVTIQQVPVCRSILVSSISEDTTQDAIELFFESPRNNGGPVETVRFKPESGRAVVVFQNSTGQNSTASLILVVLFWLKWRKLLTINVSFCFLVNACRTSFDILMTKVNMRKYAQKKNLTGERLISGMLS